MMAWFRKLTVISLFLSFTCSLWGQPFDCDGNLILSTNDGTTRTFWLQFGLGFVGYNPISIHEDESFDALGFNPKDNYIYGIQQNTDAIVRLSRDGSFEALGTLPSGEDLRAHAGDCNPDGLFLCHDNESNQILVFNVIGGFSLANRIDLYWDPESPNSGPFTTRIEDFAIDPNNPRVAYAFQGNYIDPELEPAATRGYLLEINLDFASDELGMVSPVVELPVDVIVELGSLFFTKEGGLFGYGSRFADPEIEQNRLVSINRQTGAANVQGLAGPTVPISDGCSCPYSLTFENDVNPRVTKCSDSEVTYTISVNNRSFESLADVVFTDTLAEGMIIASVDGNYTGTIDPGTGVGTRILTISDLQVPPRGFAQISITASVIDLPVGLASNQAYLRNLPSIFGGVRVSDDPANPNRDDATNFNVDAQFIEEVEFDVTPPSDCLGDNDAQIFVSSPLLVAGGQYEVGLINQFWDEIIKDVTVSASNSFSVDSLGAGEYRLDRVRPIDVQCSFELKDTFIIIEAPNEQLQITAQSNSPICEGTTLRLNATMSPAGTPKWEGPIFLSNELNTTREDAIPEYSGFYEFIATYGACEQIDSLEVVVEPAILAEIAGRREYCEREGMRLKAKGNGELSFQWSGPNNFTATSQFIEIPSMAPIHDGDYVAVLDNGACRDSANIFIDVLLSPTIDLPEIIETDFCDPVLLKPLINGDPDVEYTWTPQEGLSCYDCPAPEVLIPFLPTYQLHVINDTLCTDSTTVSLAFSVDNLIYVPNAFSPNFDGVNDYFQLFPSCVVNEVLIMEVYDRWGGTVYSATQLDPNDPRAFWDGSVNGKTATPGTFLWRIEIKLVDGSTVPLTGEINLLR